jgi:hypothetical protein
LSEHLRMGSSVDDSFQRGITVGLTLVVLSLLFTAMSKARTEPMPESEADVLRHPKIILAVGLVLTFIMSLFTIGSALAVARSGVGPPMLFLAFAAMCALIVVEYQRSRHQLVPGGMRYGRLLGRGGDFRWSDVFRLRYSSSMKWFSVELTNGATARISVMLTSLPAFASAALAHLPPDRIDDATRLVLQETAAGSPPSIWRQ